MCRCLRGQWSIAFSVSARCYNRRNTTCGFRDPVVHPRIDSHRDFDVRDSQRLDRRSRKRDYSWNCGCGSHCIGGHVCRADLWCIDESGSLVGASGGVPTPVQSGDLSGRSGDWRFARCHWLSMRARRRVLLNSIYRGSVCKLIDQSLDL